MGVNLRVLMESDEISFSELKMKKIGIDAYNWTYQFLSNIRLPTGELFMDSQGRTTSHLLGIFNRTISLLREGVIPCYVWDGKPPIFKEKTLEKREKIKKDAKESFEKAKTDEEKRKYAQQMSKLTPEMIEDAIKLLDLMGVPSVKAPSEGEAQVARMVKNGDLWACASQDWDSILFGSRFLLRNLSVSGKRKIPRTKIFVNVKPEIVDLDRNLKKLELSRKQLILVAMLIGTDYCSGVKGYGPKKALAIVKKEKTPEKVLKITGWDCDFSAEEIMNWFENPKVKEDYSLEWKKPNTEKIIKLLVDQHQFSRERVESQLKSIENSNNQSNLGSFMN